MHSWEGKKLDFTLKRHLPKRSFPNQPSLYKSIIARSIKATAGKVSAQSLKRHQSSPWALTSKSLSRRLTCWARHLTGMDGVQQFCFYLLADFFFFFWALSSLVCPGATAPSFSRHAGSVTPRLCSAYCSYQQCSWDVAYTMYGTMEKKSLNYKPTTKYKAVNCLTSGRPFKHFQ